MDPLDIARSTAVLCRLVGLSGRYRLITETEPTLEEVATLLRACTDIVSDAAAHPDEGDVARHLRRWRAVHESARMIGESDDFEGADEPTEETDPRERALLMSRAGMPDPVVAVETGLTAAQVRHLRRAAGIRGARARPSGWQQRIREAHETGATNEEIADLTGYTLRTVQEYLHRLGLRAHPNTP